MSQQESNDIVKQDLIQMIRRQTDYDEEKCIQKLKDYNGNVELVVREFHGLDKKKKLSTTLSTNQQIFKTIRENF